MQLVDNIKYANIPMNVNTLSQSEWFTTYLEYENLNEMLNVILYTSQSFMAILPQLHYITYHDKEILFTHTSIVGGIIAHYHILKERPIKKFVELNKMTGDFGYVDGGIGYWNSTRWLWYRSRTSQSRYCKCTMILHCSPCTEI